MKYKDIYDLSMKFAPPKIDLRKAQILDDYGDETCAKLLIHHKKPNDVKRKEFDYYGWVYPFMEPNDLLFYLFAIVIEFKKDNEIECIDSFMYSMDREVLELKSTLSKEEIKTLTNAFQIIHEQDINANIDWVQCKNLQKLIGISIDSYS